ncbi:MAG: tetratricopeptide repeat protein [Betaproteobacteria bacterium]
MTPDRKLIYRPIAIALVAVVATAAALYVELSRRGASAPPPTEVAAATVSMVPDSPTASATRSAAPAIDVSAQRLAQRLKEKDGSAEDWALLARSYVQMQRYPEAVQTFARALEKMPGNAAFLAEQAAARNAAAGGSTTR